MVLGSKAGFQCTFKPVGQGTQSFFFLMQALLYKEFKSGSQTQLLALLCSHIV